MEASKRYMVVVHLPAKATRASEVIGNLGQALRTADGYPVRPSVVMSGPTNMLRHAKSALTVPPHSWLTTRAFLAHCYAVAALFDFKIEVIQNATTWDVKQAKEGV
jgi:hypothetical protein